MERAEPGSGSSHSAACQSLRPSRAPTRLEVQLSPMPSSGFSTPYSTSTVEQLRLREREIGGRRPAAGRPASTREARGVGVGTRRPCTSGRRGSRAPAGTRAAGSRARRAAPAIPPACTAAARLRRQRVVHVAVDHRLAAAARLSGHRHLPDGTADARSPPGSRAARGRRRGAGSRRPARPTASADDRSRSTAARASRSGRPPWRTPAASVGASNGWVVTRTCSRTYADGARRVHGSRDAARATAGRSATGTRAAMRSRTRRR